MAAQAAESYELWTASLAEIPKCIHILEEIFQKYDVDPQIARDLGTELSDLVERERRTEGLPAAPTASSEPVGLDDSNQKVDWELLDKLAERLDRAESERRRGEPRTRGSTRRSN